MPAAGKARADMPVAGVAAMITRLATWLGPTIMPRVAQVTKQMGFPS